MADTKLQKFLADKKIDTRRLLATSYKLERLTAEDRKTKFANRKPKEGEKKAEVVGEKKKPHSGRPVTDRALNAAVSGGKLSGPTKSRILRAVNALLEKKKQAVVTLKDLF